MRHGYGQFCPVAKATEILGERWTLLILRELLLGTHRFGDFQRALSQISPSLLTKRLNELVEYELVVKKRVDGKRHYEYFLTPAGNELEPIITSLGEWGMRWARGQMSDDELDVELLMFELCRRLDESALPEGQTTIHFAFHGLEKFANWWIVVQGCNKELCVDKPAGEVDVSLITDVRTMVEIWAGDLELTAAKRSGKLTVSGSPLLDRSMKEWLRGGLLAHVKAVR